MITFKCPSCGKPMSAAEENVGKKGRCPGCQQIFTIPDSSPAVKPAPAVERRTTEPAEPAPKVKKKAEPVDDDDEAIAEVPKRAKKAAPRDEDEDVPPPRKRSKSRFRANDEDVGSNEDDRPRRKRRRDDDEDEDDDRDSRRRRKRRGPYADCPGCGCRGDATKVSWTWWGGLIGPLLISTVRCNRCGVTYNGKHGDYNGTRIAIYVGISLAIGLGLVVLRIASSAH